MSWTSTDADVLGYSFGGLLALELAHRAPEGCRRLILCATAQGLPVIPPSPVPALMLMTPARYYHPRLFRLMIPHIAGGRTRREPGPARAPGRRAAGAAPAAARLRLPAVRRLRLDERAMAVARQPADADHRRRRRPDHPARQPQADGPLDARGGAARRPGRWPSLPAG